MLLVAIGNKKNPKHLPAYHVFMESIFMKQQIISSPYNNMCNKLHVFSSSGNTDFFFLCRCSAMRG